MEIVHQMASMYNFQRYQKIAADKERLLNGSPQLITNIKSRINKKLFGEDSATSLMVNLTNLLG